MAVKDTNRVRARLSALYPKASHLSKERLDALAGRLTVTDESTDEELDTELKTRNDNGSETFEEQAARDDKFSTELDKAKKSAKPTTTTTTTTPPKEEESGEGKDKTLEDKIAALEKRLEEKDKESARQSLETKFKNDERLKGIPAFVVKGAIPQSEDDYEDAVTTLAKEYKEFADQNKLESYSNQTIPATSSGGVPNKKDVKQISDEEADDMAKQLLR